MKLKLGDRFVLTMEHTLDRPKYVGGGGYTFEVVKVPAGTVVSYAGNRYVGSDSVYEDVWKVEDGKHAGFAGATNRSSWGATDMNSMVPEAEWCGFCRGRCKGEHYVSPATTGY